MEVTLTIQLFKHRFLKAWCVLLCFLAGSLPSFSTNSSPASIRPTMPAQEGYQYVRFVKTNNAEGIRFNEIRFLNGSVEYPKLPILYPAGTFEANFVNDEVPNSQVFFDQDPSTSEWIKDEVDGETALTLSFNYTIYLTGVRITKPDWQNFTDFRVEATNDLEGDWTVLYTSPEGVGNVGQAVATFDFGVVPIEVDVTPPTTPSIAVDEVTHNSAHVSWSAIPDAWGYEVRFDGKYQGFIGETEFSQHSSLEPATTYQVEVVAYDREFNASEKATLAVTTEPTRVAQRYRYLRFQTTSIPYDDKRITLKTINWLMDDRVLPLTAITNATGDDDVEITSTNADIFAFDGPYKSFDQQDGTHWWHLEGEEATLYFKNIDVVPTGIELVVPSWRRIGGFRAEASTDGENWDMLYEQSGLTWDDYAVKDDDENLRIGTFDFGLELPDDLDTEAPSVPSALNADQLTSTIAQVSWEASTDEGSGVNRYIVMVNGQEWATTTVPEATIYALSPSTSYEITVMAQDQLGNESAVSEALTVSTLALEPALGAMAVGTGLSSTTDGIYKDGVDFAAEWANYASSNPFNPVFLEEIAHYKVLRFMDMVSTNNNWIENWPDRRQPDDADQSVKPNYQPEVVTITEGIAFEWMVKLCNLTGADMWINVPHAANDNYVRQLAALIKEHLDPSLKVYIEYSNEVFAGFGSEDYAREQGFALGLDQGDFARYDWFGDDEYARFRFYVYRSVQVFDIFSQEFGDQAERVEKVLSGWSGQPGLTRVHLEALRETQINPKGIVPDHYAIAAYPGIGVTPAVDELLPVARDLIEIVAEQVQEQYIILSQDSFNLPLITYEVGQHFDKNGEAINRQPAMYQMYIELMNALSPYINQFNHFVHMNPYRQGRAWGAKEYVGQPELEAYKYRAIKDWQNVNRNNSAIGTPIIIEQPTEVSVAEGSGVTFAPVVVGEQPIIYQWYENGTPVDGATGPEFALLQLPLSRSGTVYRFTASNALGEVTSTNISLTVEASEKAVSQQITDPVVVDGTTDAAWERATVYPLGTVNSGTVSDAQDLSGTFRTLWDKQYLYVLVNVQDNVLVPAADPEKPWEYDAIEFYIDATNDKTETYNANDRQLIYSYRGTSLKGGSGSMSFDNAQVAQTSTTDGYQVELALSWEDLGVNPTVGHFLGLDVMIVDNDASGTSGNEGKLAWWTDEDRSWSRPGNFGTVLLEGADNVITGEVIQKLTLTSVCSDNSATERRWRIRNPNDFPVTVKWQVYGIDQTETVEALAGDSFFTTSVAPDSNTVKIFWQDEEGNTHSAVKASGGAKCTSSAHTPADNSSPTEFRVYPNPAQDVLYIHFSEPVNQTTITLTDMTGRKVLEHSSASGYDAKVSLLGLPRGLYQLGVQQRNRPTNYKVLVE